MSFQKDYYKECVAEWIAEFNERDDDEILARNILSRAYYTMFLHCENVLKDEIFRCQASFSNKIIDHKSVMDAVKDTAIKTLLLEFKRYRERADYDTKKLDLRENASVCKKQPSKTYIKKELLEKIDFVFQCIK
jgi:hypothetical protein|nr:MAG TPA: hypothetical protein [Siphoviridae sp. ctUxW2]